MAEVMIKVLEIVDDSGYPTFIKCELTDYKNIKHYFIDKVPAICGNCNRYNNNLPCIIDNCSGRIRCTIVNETDKTYIIDTQSPDDVDSIMNEYQFEVWKEQVNL